MTYAIGSNLPTCSRRACCQPATKELMHQPPEPESLPVPMDYCEPCADRLEMLAMHGLPTTLAKPKGQHDA